MSKEQIEKAIKSYWDLSPGKRERPHYSDHVQTEASLTAHLAAVLGPTFDEVVEVVLDFKHQDSSVSFLKQRFNGSGALCKVEGEIIVSWPPTDTPGKAAIEAIKSAMKPEPTLTEKALEALRDIEAAPCKLAPRIKIIRRALEAER